MDEAFSHRGVNKSVVDCEYKAPDGGWGYAICVGVGLTFMLGFGSLNAFGIIFNDFFNEQGGASGLTLVIGAYNGSLSIAGFLSGIALKRYTFRQVGYIGAFLFILGDLITLFAGKTYHLVISFGIIRGAGFGVMIPVSYTAFNCYFHHKRTAMMSANQSMSSLASIAFPLLFTYMINNYGFRGTLTLLLAIDMNVLVAIQVMEPVERHMLRCPRVEPVYNMGLNGKETVVNVVKTKIGEEKTIVKVKNGESIKRYLEKPQTIADHGIKMSLWCRLLDEIDVELLKNRHFLFILIGVGFAFVSDVTYLALEPMLLYSYGVPKYKVATCIMYGAISDLVSRLMLAIYTFYCVIDSTKLFMVGIFITIFLRVALVLYSQYWYLCLITIMSGCTRCCVQVLFPLVLANAAPKDKFSSALALHIIFSGLMMFITEPLIGVVYDATGSYLYCFLSMSFCCAICIILWLINEYFS